jgi:hypothetical protein
MKSIAIMEHLLNDDVENGINAVAAYLWVDNSIIKELLLFLCFIIIICLK